MDLNFSLISILGLKFEDVKNDILFQKYFAGIDLEQIGHVYALTNEERGIDIILDSNHVVTSIHFYNGEGEIKAYTDDLPKKIKFNDNIETAHKKIGLSGFQSGESEELPILGLSKPWRKYQFDNCYLHLKFQYDKKSIYMVTLALE